MHVTLCLELDCYILITYNIYNVCTYGKTCRIIYCDVKDKPLEVLQPV